MGMNISNQPPVIDGEFLVFGQAWKNLIKKLLDSLKIKRHDRRKGQYRMQVFICRFCACIKKDICGWNEKRAGHAAEVDRIHMLHDRMRKGSIRLGKGRSGMGQIGENLIGFGKAESRRITLLRPPGIRMNRGQPGRLLCRDAAGKALLFHGWISESLF
ncbi:MAG: hypothetical protein IJL96_08985 [Clostridia bacterium]|nr:hypothetical protein [Clostridia bacterium]